MAVVGSGARPGRAVRDELRPGGRDGLALHENDRSATGFLPPERFEAVADRFFAEPETSVLGWERAVDAQARIVACVRGILGGDTTVGDILLAGHGGVGALLLAHLLGAPISRALDQPATGGGNLFAFRRADLGVIHGWRSMETVRTASHDTPFAAFDEWSSDVDEAAYADL